MNTHYYQDHDLTVAQHPSETDFRFMIRLLTFMLNADENLHFTKGLSTGDEPELWQKSLTGDIELWIELGQPDEKRLRKACGLAKKVIVYTYHQGKANVWWQQQKEKFARFKNLNIIHIQVEGIETMVKRTMDLQCTIQDAEIYVNDGDSSAVITLKQYQK